MKQKFDVTGMTCSACSAHVEKAVNKLEGVRRAEVSLMTNSMNVEYDEAALAPESIIQAVVQAGYGASLPAQAGVPARGAAKRPEAQMEAELSSMKRRLILSFLFLIPLFYISMGHMMGAPLPAFLVGHENAISFAFTQLLLTLPILYINDKYYKNGFRSLLHGGPNMDSLIAVGSIAAVIYGVFAIYQIGYGLGHGDMARVEQYHMDLYFESAGMILTLITLGKFLETRSKGKTSQAISRLMDLAPKTATVLRDGAEAEIPVEEVRVGDRVAVRPGQGGDEPRLASDRLRPEVLPLRPEQDAGILRPAVVGPHTLRKAGGHLAAAPAPSLQGTYQRAGQAMRAEQGGHRVAGEAQHRPAAGAAQQGWLTRLHGDAVEEHLSQGLQHPADGVLRPHRAAP